MFNPATVVAAKFGDHLAETYLQNFSDQKTEYATFLSDSAGMLLGHLGSSDALYHNAEHTMMVTLVGQHIIRGQLVTRAVQPELSLIHI